MAVDSTVFKNFINSLEQLEIKRTSSNFTYTGFSLFITTTICMLFISVKTDY